MFRSLTPRQLVFDIVSATLCLVMRYGIGVVEPVTYLIVLLMAAALCMRRMSPALALAIAWVGALIQISFGVLPDVSNLAILPVLYATAAYGADRTRWLGLISAGAGALIATAYLLVYMVGASTDGFSFSLLMTDLPFLAGGAGVLLITLIAAFGLSWTLGLLARTRRLARESEIARALAEADEEIAQREVAIEQERNRIARDMHDVVAHSLAVVIAQADGARYAAKGDPDAVDDALVTIAATAREALGDVRILLGQLRHSQGESPQPMLGDLGRLVEQLRAAGLDIVFEEEGDAPQLGSGRQLAVYRIVQEALTNALRHGDASREVELRLSWEPRELIVTIDNAVSAEPSDSAHPTASHGHGLAGMRERAILSGGELVVERIGRRFVVTATIPTDSEPVASAQERSALGQPQQGHPEQGRPEPGEFS